MPHRVRLPSRGCAIAPALSPPSWGARTTQQLISALGSEELDLPSEIVTALDDISEPDAGYPEAGWAQRR